MKWICINRTGLIPFIVIDLWIKTNQMKKIIALVVILSSSYYSNFAQDLNIPPPSPPQEIKQTFGLSTIEVSYSRPSVKGRKIFGDLVPFGKVWRTGANNATTIRFGDEVTIGGKKIPAGQYGLLTIPGENSWTFIISHQVDVTNPSNYKEDQDIVRVSSKSETLPIAMENFSILFDHVTNSSCYLELVWDHTAVGIPITTDIDSKIMANINTAMMGDKKPYFQSAIYYLDNGKNLDTALAWFNKASAQEPDAYFIVYHKARCLAKMGKNQDAISTAQHGMELAKKANNNDYVTLNEKLIASLK